jgi:IcmF-related N-terminal domain
MDVLYQILGAFSGLPAWMRWVFVAISLACVFGFGAFLTPIVGIIIAGGLLLVVLVVALFQRSAKKAEEKRAAEFGGTMDAQNANAPTALSGPAQRAKLDDLRRNFQTGIEKFKTAGKSLYSLPWYMIVGEPGAGKTEAIRHSAIGFPPGMQDEFQGVGGTINMNWWFTNDAIILDTAGRLMFEEVPPGSTSEWREFLGLLKTHRPNCPVNGLMLVLPAESLIKDTAAEIVKKAGRIATQLEVIQKQLDIRFPVYVVISKCDLLNGFREFFDDLTDENAGYQISGWSNPDPLDQPFRPELVEAHIQTVARRLTRRRLGLILDPAARSMERRADEVDRLFALPHSLSLIGPNLQRYLQTLFVAGQWSAKPLFLRGIYFTSSMREGSALDQELAEAMGLSVDALPEGRAWERKRSFFLRDVFTAKAFREKGLVTRASNTRKLVLRRSAILLGTGLAALLTLLAFSVLGYRSLRESVGRQSGYWARAADGWEGNTWSPIVRPKGPLEFAYVGEQPVGPGTGAVARRLFDAGDAPLSAFHLNLRELSATPLRIPWAFRLVSRFGVGVDADRPRAQRIVFEGSVVAPSIAATRERMAGLSPDAKLPEPQARAEAAALLSLVRLEAGLVRRLESKTVVDVSADDVLQPIVHYTSGQKADLPLLQTMDWLYERGDGHDKWPATWVSGGPTLNQNVAIDRGLTRLMASARAAVGEQASGYSLLLLLTAEVRKYSKLEGELYSAAKISTSPEISDEAVFASFGRLQEQRQVIEGKITQARKAGLFGDGPDSLAAAYDRLLGAGRDKLNTALAIQKSIRSILDAAPEVGAIDKIAREKTSRILFQQIEERLKPVIEELQAKRPPESLQSNPDDLRELDEYYLLNSDLGKPHYQSRWALYDKAIRASPDIRHSASLDLVGADWKPLFAVLGKIDQIEAEVQRYNGALAERATSICRYSLTRARQIHTREFCANYLIQANQKFHRQVLFPFVWSLGLDALNQEGAVAADSLLEKIKIDLHSPNFASIPATAKAPLVAFGEKLTGLDPIRKALFAPGQNMRVCTVVLLSVREQAELSGARTGMGIYPAIQMRAGTTAHGSTVRSGTPGRVPTNSQNDVILGRFTMFEPFHFHFYFSPTDSAIAVDMPAPDRWTSIMLPWERQATRLDGGKRWRLALRPGEDKLIWIELRFDAPLPPFEEWPTLRSIGLEAGR